MPVSADKVPITVSPVAEDARSVGAVKALLEEAPGKACRQAPFPADVISTVLGKFNKMSTKHQKKTVPCKPRTGSQTGLFSSHTLVVGFTVGSSKAAIIEGTFEFAVGTGDTASRLARANLFSVSVKEVFKVEASTFRTVQKKQRA